MIELKVLYKNSYKNIDLPEDFTISLNYNSGVFDFDQIAGSYSLPFQLQNTINNNRLFEFPNSLENVNQSKRELKAQLWTNGLLLHSGSLEISETDAETFKCTFKFDAGEFASEQRDKLITDCNLGGEREWIWHDHFTNENSDFALPRFMNNNFDDNILEVLNADIDFFVNEYVCSELYNGYLIKYALENGPNFPWYITAICPFPYLYKIINYIFKSLNYNLEDNFFASDEALKKLIIFNLYDAMKCTAGYNDNAATNYITYVLDTYDLKNHVPKISVHELILNLKNYFCIDFNFKDGKLKINSISDYVKSTDYIDITSKTLDYEKKYFKEKSKGFSIEFSPDTDDNIIKAIEDFGKFYNKEFEIHYNFSSRPENPEIDDIYLNLYPAFESGDFYMYLVRTEWSNENEKIITDWIELNNSLFSNYYSNFERDTTFKSNISQFFGVSEQQGVSPFHLEKKEFTKLRLGLDGGFQDVPFAFHKVDGLSLNFWTENGLFKKFWKPFTDWYFNIPYELEKKINFSIPDLKNFDFSKKYRINNHLYFIDSIKVVIRENGIVEPATVKLLPC